MSINKTTLTNIVVTINSKIIQPTVLYKIIKVNRTEYRED